MRRTVRQPPAADTQTQDVTKAEAEPLGVVSLWHRRNFTVLGASLLEWYHSRCYMGPMADHVFLAPAGGAGRSRRRPAPRRQFKTRVSDDAALRAHKAAAALGITTSEYVEALLLHDEQGPDGRPVWWDKPVPGDQKELPLTQSA